MYFTALSINVGRSRANRSLVMDVFSFVDLLFILEPPRAGDGCCVVHEHVDFDLFSFVQASGVEVFVQSSLSGLFFIDCHDMVTCIVLYDVGGEQRRVGGVYVPPTMRHDQWDAIEPSWNACDYLIGNFNARHDRWNHVLRMGTMSLADCRGGWLSDYCDNRGLMINSPGCFTFRNVSTIDLFVGSSDIRVSYNGKAGLEHVAVIARLEVEEPADITRRKPAWRKIPPTDINGILDQVNSGSDEDIWSRLRSGVDALPRSGRGVGRCSFWNDDLGRIHSDLNRIRRYPKRTALHEYNTVRRVYRAMLLKSRNEFISRTIKSAGDSAIFRLARQLEQRRTLPSMMTTDGTLVHRHENIADLVAAQLGPGDEQPWPSLAIDMEPATELETAIRRSPTNTGPSLDDIGYPFIRYWHRERPDSLRRLIDHGLVHDIPDWHSAEVVLISKADKPRYDIVKSWTMIHLLPTISKVV